MSETKWNIAVHDKERLARITGEFKISELTAKLLINRGYNADNPENKEKIKAFLDKSKDLFHDPFLIPDMAQGVDRIHSALINKEKVMIYGDYDVDGISSTCIMFMYLKNLGIDVSYYIPDRFEEGYGINNEAVKKAKENNIKLIITVDTGITAFDETLYAKSLGIDIIITDHHECPKILPGAVAVINPKKPESRYPFKELSGVGVAFKVIWAYNIKYNNENGDNGKFAFDFAFESYCEFVAMGTVADIMPLADENRVMVGIGLKSMANSKNFGMNAMLESYFKYKGKKNISTDIIGFYISPRINAAGRLAKADRAVELFLSVNKNTAEIISDELSVLNRQRQETEKEIFIQAENELRHIKDKDNKKIIILHNDNWHQGVIGIVSSKLSEKYNKAFILFAKDSGGVYKGSCRSVKNINITELLADCSALLIKYGGHERAAGLSAKYENIQELEKKLNEYAVLKNMEIEDDKIYDIECELQAENITCDTVRELEALEPFGNANPVPLFAVTDCKIVNITQVGENKHTKLELTRGRFSFEAIYFNMDAEKFEYNKYDCIDIACSIGINEFMNREKVQYIVRDIRLSEKYAFDYNAEKENYNRFINNGGGVRLNNGDIPDREDFKSIYIFLLNSFKKDVLYNSVYNINKLQSRYFDYSHVNISRFKFRIILDIFGETDIIYIEHDFDNINKIKINKQSEKTDLDNSPLYKRLKEYI